MNLKDLDWTTAKKRLEEVFGDDCFVMSDKGDQLIISTFGHALAIVKVYKKEKFMSLHLRASVRPEEAAYIASTLVIVGPLTVDEVFEYDFKGDMLGGENALLFAAENMPELWFGFPEKKKGKKNDRPDFLN